MATAESLNGAGDTATRLTALAAGRETLDVAQIQFVAMDELRRAHATRWPEQQARILDGAEAYLRRRLRPGDLLVQSGEGFIVMFQAAGPAAAVGAALLANGLNGWFLAEATRNPTPQVAVRMAHAPVKDLAARLGERRLTVAQPELGGVASEPGWRYQPVWDVKRETLTSWYVTPYSPNDGGRLPGYQFEDTAFDAERFATVDAAGLMIGETALRRLISHGKQALVGASIHVASLADPTTLEQVLAALDQLDPALARYRILKIAAIPPSAPKPWVADMVRRLARRLPNVVLGCAWDEPDIAGLAATDAVAVGVSIPPAVASPHSTLSRADLNARISDAVAIAHGARKRLFVEGAVNHDLASRARLLGVDNISSPFIWAPTAHPDAMTKWPADRLAA